MGRIGECNKENDLSLPSAFRLPSSTPTPLLTFSAGPHLGSGPTIPIRKYVSDHTIPLPVGNGILVGGGKKTS